MPVTFDLKRLLTCLEGRRTGIIATPAGWVPGVGNVGDAIIGEAQVTALFALEHGWRGDLQDGVLFGTCNDERTGLPVYSYYGGSHTFPQEVLNELDAVIFHAQDVSHRAYTYKQSLAETLQACAGTQTEVVVLDRPTPLGHLGSRGPFAIQFFPLEIPAVIGHTLGELALWLQAQMQLDVKLTVIPVDGWTRHMTWEDTGLPWVPPSPNIPSVLSCYAYACTGLIQHTVVSEARGTCKPFEYVGAPFIDAEELTDALNAHNLPGIAFRETYFTPAFNKFAGQLCAGVHLMFLDRRRVAPIRTALVLLQTLARLYPDDFTTQPRLAAWLDGEPWPPERLATLDIPEFLRAQAQGTREFRSQMAPLELYRSR